MFTVAALYCFAPFEDPAALQGPLKAQCLKAGIRGTLLLAREGINGTIAGTEAGISEILADIRALPGCADLDVKYSTSADWPFQRMKVRLKKEIVTLGRPEVDPARDVGTYVQPEDWNALISDPETIVIDTRNDYEVAIGSFRGALDPKTKSFGEFPHWFEANKDTLAQAPKIAMFCTGGIRCEKSTAFLRQQGLSNVFHLKGGILNYLEKVPEAESLWEGACFVFDDRVSLGHGLVPGGHDICPNCTWPMAAGKTCQHCA